MSKRGFSTIRITKVKGHADDDLVRVGAEQGDSGAHMRDARRVLSKACHYWYPLKHEFLRFFSVAHIAVTNNGMGGTAVRLISVKLTGQFGFRMASRPC